MTSPLAILERSFRPIVIPPRAPSAGSEPICGIDRSDRTNAIAACRSRGGEVMLAEDGGWRCVCWPSEGR